MAAPRAQATDWGNKGQQSNMGPSSEGDSSKDEGISHQNMLLISEIESSEGHMGNTLRAVYDEDEPEKFMESLDTRIKAHDKEIERMCNYHYQGFMESVRGLLQLRSDAEKLQNEVKQTNAALQDSGKQLINRAENLVKYRKVQRNIASAVETLSNCLPVLEAYGKLKDQMKSKRFYPALKTLEQLEHTYLPRLSKYRFSKPMCNNIPTMRDQIKEASMSDLKDFLENIRKHSERIGEVAMKQAAEQHNMDPSIALKKVKKRRAPAPPNPFGSPTEKEDSGNPFSEPSNPFDEPENPFDEPAITMDGPEPPIPIPKEENDENSAQDLVDFSPVYRCLHIYTVLGARETFEVYYRKQRWKQARLVLQPPTNMDDKPGPGHTLDPLEDGGHETLEGYKKYFHDIIGFFVVEDHILNTTSGLVNRMHMDQLWDMAQSKIIAVLRTHSAFCTDPELMLQIKDLIMLFCHSLRSYGFPVSQIYDLLLEIRDQYSEILMQRWVIVFNKVFDEDDYTPIWVETKAQYKTALEKFPYRDPEVEKLPYPKNLPYSRFVPRIFTEVKEYIKSCLKFSDDLSLSHTEIDDMIRKLANVLLTRTLSGCLSALIRRPNLSLLQLIQISINVNYLERSVAYLEDYISSITGAERDSVHMSKLQGISVFKDARNEADEQIYKQLNKKVEEFFELADYKYTLEEPTGAASSYIMDLVAFLEGTFKSFTNLPLKVAQTACMAACKHIATLLMDFLLNKQINAISIGALEQFNLDLMQCEVFALSDPVPEMGDGTLTMAFAELRQLLDLFLSWDWSTYLAEFGQDHMKYLRVNPHTAMILLEKMKDGDKKNVFTTFAPKADKDRKKLVDMVLKQLRGLSNGTT